MVDLFAVLLGLLIVHALALVVLVGLVVPAVDLVVRSLHRPTLVLVASAGLALAGWAAVGGPAGLYDGAHLLAVGVPWWMAFGRVPGAPRVDAGRRVTAGMLVLASVAHFGGLVVARGQERAPWDRFERSPGPPPREMRGPRRWLVGL